MVSGFVSLLSVSVLLVSYVVGELLTLRRLEVVHLIYFIFFVPMFQEPM